MRENGLLFALDCVCLGAIFFLNRKPLFQEVFVVRGVGCGWEVKGQKEHDGLDEGGVQDGLFSNPWEANEQEFLATRQLWHGL